MEGDSVTLNSRFIEMMDDDEFWRIRSKVLTDDQIEWRFSKTLIAKINRRVNTSTVYDDVLDGRFRDRLKLDNQTLSLTITNITTEDAGDYKLKITGTKPSSITFIVSVYNSEYCCGSTEAVMRLVLSALVGVATVILLVYDIRSRRAEQYQAHIHTSGT
uniref:Immunoglobulin V-set domain-containing protein n=1 Tax=Cyprinus carpio TaxID=7962 RepID=A0A8C2FHT2_CYPCA